MKKPIKHYLSDDVRIFMYRAIQEARGNEVFFIGRVDENKVVDRVDVLARGNEVEVPAIIRSIRHGEVVIHNHPSGNLNPSSADNRVASLVGNEGAGFYIVNNEVSELYAVVEPTVLSGPQNIDVHHLRHFLDAGGPLAQKLSNFERRESQLIMLEKVAEAFNDNRIALIEAGTGTGKTMAYLLPAIEWGLANGKRVAVSTNTINLQQQLTEKDIPLLKDIFPKPFRAELVKGRTNYVCLRKLNLAVNQPSLLELDDLQNELSQIYEWAQKTSDGSKSDLGIQPSERVWEAIQSESDTTLKSKCPYYDRCFFYNARRRAATADILIVNHHLLFADLAMRSQAEQSASEVAVLPRYERIIFDEAHNLEDVASKYFGSSISYLGILRILNRLYRRKDGREVGLLMFVKNQVESADFFFPGDLAREMLELIEEKMIPMTESLKATFTEFADSLLSWLKANASSNYEEIKLRITPKIRTLAEWKDLMSSTPSLIKQMHQLADYIYKVVEGLSKASGAFSSESLSMAVDLRAQAERLVAATNSVDMVLLRTDEETIRWIEARQGRTGPIIRFCTAPMDITPIMRHSLYETFPAIVMTSATLSVAKSFDFFSKRIGLSQEKRKLEAILPSPFDYANQVIIGIPSDMAEPNTPAYESKLAPILLQAIRASKGSAFVLFTSYALLNKMYDELKMHLEADGLTVLRQGDMSRHVLLNLFRENISSVLFGTDSFWEGVDVQGESLLHVIIPRLPFRVPSEPIIEARVEDIQQRGGNAFLEYTVPQAVIKFKQGFGRLIRTREDFGAITILDRRIISRVYGRIFLESLPDCQVVIGESEEVFHQIETFLRSHRGG